ncbi:HlyD family efflux transporter periplasmic adaptor subunit [Pseudoduganella sp. FT55W]|uniref:HlyD family efflux transporter periplasmic adaptor subunit n=1 Tax=Duganella rivi TaxID=2666083 RepID=A0A7X4GNP7_9BURK|nr:HlyD family efflux transporter periplasmic adaptor subunit [Duganella rivi]MYM66286.1 HlyD family efflux transporter periplasmic adaptor subunit [Duganella rivi]
MRSCDQLFREEILRAHGASPFGSIILMRPVPILLAAWIAILLSVALCLFLILGKYTPKVRVTGQIVPVGGAIRAVAPQFGRIVTAHVHEGAAVTIGQVIYELSSERNTENRNIDTRINAALVEKQKLLDQEQLMQVAQLTRLEQALGERRRLSQAGLTRFDQEILLQQNRVANITKVLARYRSLREEGFVSELQLIQYESEQGEQLGRLQTLERAKLDALRDLRQIDADTEQLRSQIVIGNLQARRARSDLEHEVAEQSARARIQVLAPATGRITALSAVMGESVGAGAVLATVIPADCVLEAHLMAPSRAIGFVSTGQSVRLRVAAFPYQKFGQIHGTVGNVELSPSSSGALSQVTEPMYRITVQLARQSVDGLGRQHQFKAGMAVEADMRQEPRRLINWLFDPILSAAKDYAS